MFKIKKCPKCKAYTMKDVCEKCKEKTLETGYKFKEKFVNINKITDEQLININKIIKF